MAAAGNAADRRGFGPQRRSEPRERGPAKVQLQGERIAISTGLVSLCSEPARGLAGVSSQAFGLPGCHLVRARTGFRRTPTNFAIASSKIPRLVAGCPWRRRSPIVTT